MTRPEGVGIQELPEQLAISERSGYLLNSIKDKPGIESLAGKLKDKAALWETGSGKPIPSESLQSFPVMHAFPQIKKEIFDL